MPGFGPALAQLESQGHKVGGEGMDPNLHPLDYAAATTMGIPLVGDLVGLAADARMYAQEPESRTPFNYGLSALGALPFVPSAAGIMRGTKSAISGPDKVVDVKNLSKAIELDDGVVNPLAIMKETGWYKGADGQWRTEIPDFASAVDVKKLQIPRERLNTFGSAWNTVLGRYESGVKLKSLLKHDDLFKYYPDFNPDVVTYYNPMEKAYGGFDEANDVIMINLAQHYDDAADIAGAKKGPAFEKAFDDAIRSTVLLETQHGIQGVENFARGANEFSPSYTHSAGEVESNMIQARADLPPSQLGDYPPMDFGSQYGMKYPYAEQVVEYDPTGINR